MIRLTKVGENMELSKEKLELASEKYGDAFYVLDTGQFKKNYKELESTFKVIYSKFAISYSYKTNYIPEICKAVNELGGYAEVVSDMECQLAEKIGADREKIVLNGPYKKKETIKKLLLAKGIVNIDSLYDFKIIKKIAAENPENEFRVGIRCNFPVGDNAISRFGFDTDGEELKKVLSEMKQCENISLRGLHCHFASRNLDYWPQRGKKIIELAKRYFSQVPEYISLGGGIFGKMPKSLEKQFDMKIPSYQEYAESVAYLFQEEYGGLPENKKPILFIEPGSALAGDILKFVCRVLNIKKVRGNSIATVLGSIYNINPTLNKKNLPLTAVSMGNCQAEFLSNLDIAGYTCIENDYLYRGYEGNLAAGDFLIFDNVGSYSIVLKPPFILPNFPIIEYRGETMNEIKREENFGDIFHTYKF